MEATAAMEVRAVWAAREGEAAATLTMEL